MPDNSDLEVQVAELETEIREYREDLHFLLLRMREAAFCYGPVDLATVRLTRLAQAQSTRPEDTYVG